MSTTIKELIGHHECLHHESDETTSGCTCGFVGLKRNQLFDHSYSCCCSDIADEDSEEELFEINILKEPLDTIREDCESSVFSLDFHNGGCKDLVYVAVGGGDSSMEALSWALKHAITPSTILCLIHVFPVIRLIPTPLGKIPRSHVSPEYVNLYLTQEKGKRKVMLQRFIDLCLASKVSVEIMFIEGDKVAKAIADLVTNLSIRKLVIGTGKSNLSKIGSPKPNAVADKVLKRIPEICDVKIICQEKEVIDQMIQCASSRSCDSSGSKSSQNEDKAHASFVPFMRFMPTPIGLFRPKLLSPK